jgi:hypothetical protein
MATIPSMNLEISQEAYEKYLEKQDTISNFRIRPDNESFFDALMSVDMAIDPDGKKVIEIVKVL